MRGVGIGLASVVIAAVFYGLLSEALLFASHYIPPSGNAMPVVVLLGLLVSPTSLAGLLVVLLTAWLFYRRVRRLLEPQLPAAEPR